MQYHKTLGITQGIAMTVTTFVGTGLMVVPAMSVTQAGSFAFYAWLLTAIAVVPVAFVFALLGSRYPSAGGAASYIGRVFGKGAERAAGWLFLSIMLVGPAVAIKIAAAYLGILLGVSADYSLSLSIATLVVMMVFAIAGMKNSANFQTLVVISLIAVVVALFLMSGVLDADNLTQIPTSFADATTLFWAAGTIFWCFLGIEVMAHMGAEFKRPERDFPIALLGGITLVVALYIMTVLMIAHHHTYGDEITNSRSLALLVSAVFGEKYQFAFALGAYVIAFSNVGVYILGFARMIQSMASQRALPHYFAKLSSGGTPVRAVSLVGGVSLLSIVAVEVFGARMEWLIEMTNGSFLLIYTFTCICALRCFSGLSRAVALIGLVACLAMAVFIGINMLFALVMFALAYLWEKRKSSTTRLPDAEFHVE